MKSELTNVTAGIGTLLPWVEKEDTYVDKRAGLVKMPHEAKGKDNFDKMCENLSGQVTTYFLEGYGEVK
jgi:hypothetical protein